MSIYKISNNKFSDTITLEIDYSFFYGREIDSNPMIMLTDGWNNHKGKYNIAINSPFCEFDLLNFLNSNIKFQDRYFHLSLDLFHNGQKIAHIHRDINSSPYTNSIDEREERFEKLKQESSVYICKKLNDLYGEKQSDKVKIECEGKITEISRSSAISLNLCN